jgi:hypothetical protein
MTRSRYWSSQRPAPAPAPPPTYHPDELQAKAEHEHQLLRQQLDYVRQPGGEWVGALDEEELDEDEAMRALEADEALRQMGLGGGSGGGAGGGGAHRPETAPVTPPEHPGVMDGQQQGAGLVEDAESSEDEMPAAIPTTGALLELEDASLVLHRH